MRADPSRGHGGDVNAGNNGWKGSFMCRHSPRVVASITLKLEMAKVAQRESIISSFSLGLGGNRSTRRTSDRGCLPTVGTMTRGEGSIVGKQTQQRMAARNGSVHAGKEEYGGGDQKPP